MDWFVEGEFVITPLGEVAEVIGMGEDGRVELHYEEALIERNAYVALEPKLLRRYVPGERMPHPVRLDLW
jgi:hypothetical protein